MSTAEAKYIALPGSCKETIWLKKVLNDFDEKNEYAIFMNKDNQSCLTIIETGKYSNRTKHIDIKYYFVRDLTAKNIVVHCPSDSMEADILTKPLVTTKIGTLRDRIGLLL